LSATFVFLHALVLKVIDFTPQLVLRASLCAKASPTAALWDFFCSLRSKLGVSYSTLCWCLARLQGYLTTHNKGVLLFFGRPTRAKKACYLFWEDQQGQEAERKVFWNRKFSNFV
jgi:hypothetical protein